MSPATWPAGLRGRSYRCRRRGDGAWRVDARGGAGPEARLVVRRGPPCGSFRLSAEVVAAWSLTWALKREPVDD